MTRLFNAVCAAGRIAYLALAGTAVLAASTHAPACAAWVAIGLVSVWYIGETLLALSCRAVLHACAGAAALAAAAGRALAPWRARLAARLCLARGVVARCSASPRFARSALAAFFVVAFLVLAPVSLSATDGNVSPWETVGVKLCELFYGKLGKALAIVAVVIGGLLYAFGEGGSKSQLAGIAFGTGMVLLAPAFLTWLFGGTGMTCQSAFTGI